MDWRSKAPTAKKYALVGLGITLIGQTIIPSYAMGLPFSNSSAPKKGTALQYEVYSKLSTGAGPSTNDLKKQEAKLDTATSRPVDLSPVKLDDENKSATTNTDTDATGMLKAKAERHNVMESGPVQQTSLLLPSSLKQTVGEKVLNRDSRLMQNAKQVNVLPLALQPTQEEEQKTEDVKFNAEKLELADLWDSTLARSQDIQFVVQKLMPNSNSGKTTNVMMRLLSGLVFGGAGAAMMMAPNVGTQMGMNMGVGMIMQGLNGVQAKNDKRQKISQEEAIMLYNMVRTTSEKLVDHFRDYKKNVASLKDATTGMDQLQNMLKEARPGQDSAKQFEMEYTMQKARRELNSITEDVRRDRQSLVDLAGAEAVTKLDKTLESEQQKVDEVSTMTADHTAPVASKDDVAADKSTVPN